MSRNPLPPDRFSRRTCNQSHSDRSFTDDEEETTPTNDTSNDFQPECYQHNSFDDNVGTSSSLIPLSVIGVLAIILISGIFKFISSNDSNRSCSYGELEKLFPKEDNKIWNDLSVGIEDILNKKTEHPGVYLFLHKDKDYVRKVVKRLATESSKCYGDSMEPVELEAEGFSNDEYGRIIEVFKNNLKTSRVVLIANLNEISAVTAKALHYICDTYTPISKDAIIYLTLVPSVVSGSPTATARKTLSSLWSSKLDQNELEAVITRVTDMVIQLRG